MEHDHQRPFAQAGVMNFHAIRVGVAMLDLRRDVRRRGRAAKQQEYQQ